MTQQWVLWQGGEGGVEVGGWSRTGTTRGAHIEGRQKEIYIMTEMTGNFSPHYGRTRTGGGWGCGWRGIDGRVM